MPNIIDLKAVLPYYVFKAITITLTMLGYYNA